MTDTQVSGVSAGVSSLTVHGDTSEKPTRLTLRFALRASRLPGRGGGERGNASAVLAPTPFLADTVDLFTRWVGGWALARRLFCVVRMTNPTAHTHAESCSCGGSRAGSVGQLVGWLVGWAFALLSASLSYHYHLICVIE
jgi:hypothetical protein